MRLLFTLFAFISFVVVADAQIKITEISYNPPESGMDSLEYIEIYNTMDIEIDLTGYMIMDNFATDTFQSVLIPAGGYLLTAANVSAISDILGLTAVPTPNISLRNGGEEVMLLDPAGTVIDAVDYMTESPWPTFADGADGGGASIELCNIEADGSNGANWRAADNDLGVVINDRAMLGTPGAANTTTCEVAPDVISNNNNEFLPRDITINVGETVVWANEGGFHNVNGSQEVYPDNPESFSSGPASSDLWTFSHTFETPGVYDYRCDPHFQGFDMVGTVTVEGEVDPGFPVYDIATITTIDGNGVADSIGRPAAVVAVTHGTNFRPGGLQFTIIDANGDGMGVFSSSDNFGFEYEEGAEVKVSGFVTQFRGLTQLEAMGVEVISTGNDLTDAIPVTSLGEDTESQLVETANAVDYVDPDAWGNGNDFGFNVEVTDGTNSYNVRIDNDSPLFTADRPEGPFVLRGIGGQFDNNGEPFDEGYQLAPRYISDFMIVNSTEDQLTADVSLYPNPVVEFINIDSEIDLDQVILMNVKGQIISSHVNSYRLDVSDLQSGLYYVKVISGSKAKILNFYKR